MLKGAYLYTEDIGTSCSGRNENDKGELEEKMTWSRVRSQTHVTWVLMKVSHGWGRWVITGEDGPGASRGATGSETQQREVRWRHKPGRSPLVAAWWAGKGPRQVPKREAITVTGSIEGVTVGRQRR
ncbi:hypothetical protein BHE74_00053112 [Ensete ventricosum]|nr:hypothetical protein GW17_00059739 [Ensete ventricosum]RWW41404.1 hypothetical protein BHE74_00053112 [Ensete ventricosum]RZS05126.1 hypothetical protein BHM03_00035583 [Ensete ventricosum]